MRFFVGIMDHDWFDFLSRMDGLGEVNFWQPNEQEHFRALQIGEPFLFKLHSPDDFIVGGLANLWRNNLLKAFRVQFSFT